MSTNEKRCRLKFIHASTVRIEVIKNLRNIIGRSVQRTAIYREAGFPIDINPVNSTAGTASPDRTTCNWFLAQLGFSASEWSVSRLGTDDDRGYARKYAAGTSRCERGMITNIWRVDCILRGGPTDTFKCLI